MKLDLNEEVAAALRERKPVVALESTVIAHGLPYPENLKTALELEEIVRAAGAVPATVAVFGGIPAVGLDRERLERLAAGEGIRKISRRDLPIALARGLDCATTVATTMFFAHRAGIRVFATGGIGGVHRGSGNDVSADLPELAATPLVTVCAGAKIVLDLNATREWLETHGVCVLGYGCDEFPAFYSNTSGLAVDQRVETPGEVAAVVRARDELGLPNAVLVAVPVPRENEMEPERVEKILGEALRKAEKKGVTGKDLTPFLLSGMAEQSVGQTLRTNIALLRNNAATAAAIAAELY